MSDIETIALVVGWITTCYLSGTIGYLTAKVEDGENE